MTHDKETRVNVADGWKWKKTENENQLKLATIKHVKNIKQIKVYE